MDEPPPRTTWEARAVTADVVRDGGDWSFAEPIEEMIAAAVAALNAELGLRAGPPREAVVALADDLEVRRLNSAFRGQDKATNVLSFEADRSMPSPGAMEPLGDIVLASETIGAEALALEILPRHHLAHLVVHGLLHLLGHDHDEPKAAGQMEALETAILARMGLPDPYDDERFQLATQEMRPSRNCDTP